MIRTQFNVRIPADLQKKVFSAASRSGLTLNQFAEQALHSKVLHVELFKPVRSLGKVPDDIVLKILEDRETMTFRQLAQKYNLGLRTVNRICRGLGCYGRVQRYPAGRKYLKWANGPANP